MSKSSCCSLKNPSGTLFVVGQAALGVGLGILLAGRLDRSQRQTGSLVALSVGIAALLPAVLDGIQKQRQAAEPKPQRRVRHIPVDSY